MPPRKSSYHQRAWSWRLWLSAPGRGAPSGADGATFGVRFALRMARIAGVLIRGGGIRDALLLLALFALAGLQQWLAFKSGSVPSELVGPLVDRSLPHFAAVLPYAVLWVVLSGLAAAVASYAGALLAVRWRRSLTDHLLDRTFSSPHVHYDLCKDVLLNPTSPSSSAPWTELDEDGDNDRVDMERLGSGTPVGTSIDNPDQRIAQDSALLCSSLSATLSAAVAAPLIIALYSVQAALNIAWYAPLLVFAYFFAGAVASKVAVSRAARRVFAQEHAEGDFRARLVRVGGFAESIALMRGERAELVSTGRLLAAVVRAALRVAHLQMLVGAVSNLWTYAGSILAYAIVAIPVLRGDVDGLTAGELAEYVTFSVFVVLQIVYGCSIVILLSTSISNLAGYAGRVGELLERLDSVERSRTRPLSPTDVVVAGETDDGGGSPAADGAAVELTGVDVVSPQGSVLIRAVSVRVAPRSGLLISGPSGCGKSTLLRMLGGLWPLPSGHMALLPVGDGGAMFLPQRTYLPAGSLRQQLRYPSSAARDADAFEDRTCAELLDRAGLGHLLEEYGLDREDVPYADMLSPGEQQRLCFARLLYHAPRCVFLDESTSNLDATAESSIYDRLRALGITYVTVGHHESLVRHHDAELRVAGDGDGSWGMLAIRSA